MDIWAVGTSNYLLIRFSYTEGKFPKMYNSNWQYSALCHRSVLCSPFYLS